MEVLAGMDFFTVEVLTWSGLATYYVLFLIHLESRRITIAGITRHPTETWMEQMARNLTDESTGCLRHIRYVLHDRDTKFCASFESILTAAGVKAVVQPGGSMRDELVVEAAQKAGVTMYLTGERHFYH